MSAFSLILICLSLAVFLSAEDVPVHHVQQVSRKGIQKIDQSSASRVDADGAESLPLSIESGAGSANRGYGNSNSDVVNKRQTSPKQTMQQDRTVSKSHTTSRVQTKTEKTFTRTEEQPQKAALKEASRVEPKANEYGLGSTFVLTVPETENQPSYVDQTQPHQLAKPLKYGDVDQYEEQRKPASPKPVRQVIRNNQNSGHRKEAPAYSEASENSEYENEGRKQPVYNPVTPVYQEDSPNVYNERKETRRDPVRGQQNSQFLSYNEQNADSSYVHIKPPTTTPLYQNSYQQQNNQYAGFPESIQEEKNGAVSRPLQFEPPRVFPASPCNTVFNYEGREPGADSWSGDIYVSTEEVLIGMRLDITLDRPARLLANWVADVKTRDNIHFTILSLKKRLIPGPAETVKIHVKFQENGAIPYLQSINLNGRRICPSKAANVAYQKPTTKAPVYENPGDVFVKPTTQNSVIGNNEFGPPSPPRITRQPERVTTESYQPPKRNPPPFIAPERPDPNPNNYAESAGGNRLPNNRPDSKPPADGTTPNIDAVCGRPSVQPRPLVTHGQMTARGQWPWHAAIYKNVGTDLSYICGGSLISTRHVVTAAHCVTQTYDVKPLDANVIVVYLGKYHLKLWSEGGVQNKQVSSVKVHPSYNNSDFRADLAVLVLSSDVNFTEYIRPVCLWDSNRVDISEIENKEGTVLGWGFDEKKRLTEELMQAKMPVIKHETCLWSYPEFFPQFTSNFTYCAGFRNGTSVCNGDSGGGMVFPFSTTTGERWHLRGLVSISVSEKDNRICDTKHYVVFTDLAKYLNWLRKFV